MVTISGGVVTIVAPWATASLNRYAFSHWRVQHADKQRWIRFFGAARMAGAPMAYAPVRVDVERRGAGRPLDPDNLYGGLKPLLDGMRAAELIVDDSEAWIELVARNGERAPRPGQTVITIQEIRR